MLRHAVNPRIQNPQYITPLELYEQANHYFRFYIVWYKQSEVLSLAPKVYVKGYASIFRLTMADGSSCPVAWNSRSITIIRRTMQ